MGEISARTAIELIDRLCASLPDAGKDDQVKMSKSGLIALLRYIRMSLVMEQKVPFSFFPKEHQRLGSTFSVSVDHRGTSGLSALAMAVERDRAINTQMHDSWLKMLPILIKEKAILLQAANHVNDPYNEVFSMIIDVNLLGEVK